MVADKDSVSEIGCFERPLLRCDGESDRRRPVRSSSLRHEGLAALR